MWDAITRTYTEVLEGHSNWVYFVAYSPDEASLVSVSSDHIIRTWDIATTTCISTLKGHSDFVTSVSCSPDGTRLASLSDDQDIQE